MSQERVEVLGGKTYFYTTFQKNLKKMTSYWDKSVCNGNVRAKNEKGKSTHIFYLAATATTLFKKSLSHIILKVV